MPAAADRRSIKPQRGGKASTGSTPIGHGVEVNLPADQAADVLGDVEATALAHSVIEEVEPNSASHR